MVRGRLQGSRRLLLGAADLAAGAAELRPAGLRRVGGLGASPLTLDGRAAAADREPELGLQVATTTSSGSSRTSGSRSTASSRPPGGNPLDTFGRNLYVDTFNSAYGAGWKRENSFLTHKGTGTFCYGFYSHGSRPVGAGERYRATIIGPGVTPDIYWEADALTAYDKDFDLQQHARRRSSSPATRSARPSSLAVRKIVAVTTRRRAPRGDAPLPGRGRVVTVDRRR